MGKTIKDNIQGWEISFTRNVHMYCHRLTAIKEQHEINIQCEDLAAEEKTVGVWLYDLGISEEIEKDLQKIILRWANSLDERVKIYTSRDEFIYNKHCA